MYEGSPDGSRWLGLDRRAFLATACINQAQLLAISDDPGLLQEHIQRAAATRGTDATAAAAIERLADFRRVQVGEDRANSTRPLRQARVARDRAWTAVVAAQGRHDEYLALAAETDLARERADREAEALRPLVAALAAERADRARERADRAATLAAALPEGPPAGLAAADDVAGRVAAAIDAWDDRPAPIALDERTAEALELELGRLPAVPTGDLDPAGEVIDAKAGYDRRLEARRLAAEAPTSRPAAGPAGPPTGADASAALPGSVAPADPDRTWTLIAMAAAASGLAGAAALLAVPLLGVGLLAVAAILGVAAVRVRRTAVSWAGADERRIAGDAARIDAAQRRAEQATADEAREARDAEADRRDWERLLHDRTAALDEARRTLADRLGAHGTTVAPDGDLEAAFERYLADCRTRAALARDAARRPALISAIDARRDLERSAAATADRLISIRAQLRSAAEAAGIPIGAGDDPESTAVALRAWLTTQGAERRATEAATLEWRELETLLGDRTLGDLEADAASLADVARDRLDGIDARRASPPPGRAWGPTPTAGSPSSRPPPTGAAPRPIASPGASPSSQPASRASPRPRRPSRLPTPRSSG